MVFTSTPVDGSGTPIPMSSAVPDGTNTPLAIEGGPAISTGGNSLVPVSMYVKDGNDVTLGTSTDANTVASVMGRLTKIRDLLTATLTVSVSNAVALGQALMSASSPVTLASDQTGIGTIAKPVISEAWIENAIRNGQGYTASATGTTAGAADPALLLFNNSTAKNFFIYSITIMTSVSMVGTAWLRAITTDPAIGAVTPSLLKLGGSASVATCEQSNTQATLLGNAYRGIGVQNAGNPAQILQNGTGILLPTAAANGIVTQFVFGGAQSWFASIDWIEY